MEFYRTTPPLSQRNENLTFYVLPTSLSVYLIESNIDVDKSGEPFPKT